MASEALHTTVHHQCAACSQLFRPSETFAALVYRNSSLEIYKDLLFTSIGLHCEQQTEKDLHARFCRRSGCALCLVMRGIRRAIPDAADLDRLSDGPSDESLSDGSLDGWRIFCKRASCYLCGVIEESISVHTDCLELFERHCTIGDGGNGSEQQDEKYRRLWLAGTRRYAWREMQPLKFASSVTLTVPPPEMISKICGFQKAFLPEVLRLIQSHSKSHIIWRYCSAIQLARELGSGNPEAVTYEAPKVLSWSRGSPPKLVQDESHAGACFRFTIDHRGLRSIDRFPDFLLNTAGEMPASSCVFAVASIEQLSDVKIIFELGMGRLQGTRGTHITTCSTPNPLHLMCFTQPHSFDRLAAVSLDPEHCTGISFFMASHVVREIYAHSKRHSTHLERFRYLRSMFDHEIGWIYVPLTAHDKITAIEIRQNVTMDRPHLFQIWTKTGKITVGTPQISVKIRRTRPGHNSRRPVRGILYETGEDARRPLNLIHCIPGSSLMTFIGTDADKQTETTEADVDPQHAWPLPHAFFSSASLEGVVYAHVFSAKSRNLCKGILFEYDNGSKRSVGQCRHFTNPKDVFHQIQHKSVQVTFDSESDRVSEDGTLEKDFYPMKGCLNFWFRVNDVEIEIVGS